MFVAENGEHVRTGAAMLPVFMKLQFESCYQALLAQDARFDGQFFVAVKTTGIYCRPVCAARRPLRKSCIFVETAAAAERAGFRPCLRCRPELAPGTPAVSMEEALFAAIRARATQGDSVDELARRSGFSARQLRRVLVQAFGVTPVDIMQTERLLFAKKLLQETALGMSEVALERGLRQLAAVQRPFPQALRPGADGAAAARPSGRRRTGRYAASAPELPAAAGVAGAARVPGPARGSRSRGRLVGGGKLCPHGRLRQKEPGGSWRAVRAPENGWM